MLDAPQKGQASATGTLASRPLVHLLVYARTRRLTGTLVIEGNGVRGSVDLWRGRIHRAITSPPTMFFGAVAYELGRIDTNTLHETLLEIARSKRLHGEVLIERGAITAAERDEILAEQTSRKIHSLFTLPPEGTFAFYDERPASEAPVFTLDPINPVWRGLRDKAPAGDIRQVLDRYDGTILEFTNEAPVAHAGFTTEERALCEKLSSRAMTLAELHVASPLTENHVDRLVYLLLITKCVEPATTATPSVASVRAVPPVSQMRPATPRAITPSPMSRPVVAPQAAQTPGSGEVHVSLSFRVPSVAPRGASSVPPASTPNQAVAATTVPAFGPMDVGAADIARRAQALDKESVFEALGLPEGATAEAARAAYFRLAKLWHPDRLSADLKPFAGEVEKIFRHMTRAHAVLTDPAARQAHFATAVPKGIADRPRAQVLREIENAVGKRDFATVEQDAKALLAVKNDDSDALAFVAWASCNAGDAPEETLRAALTKLDATVRSDAYCERAYFYRGLIHKKLGNIPASIRDFTRAVQLEPKHVDAQRELRLFEMRSRKGSGEHALGLLLGKTKKK